MELGRLQEEAKECRDDLQKKQRQLHSLKERCDRFEQIFNSANDGIIIHDEKGRILYVNHTMHHRLGYTKSEFLQLSLQDLVSPKFGLKIKKRVNTLKKDGVGVFESEDLRKDGTGMPVEISARRITYLGKPAIQSVVRDIHKRKLAEELITAMMEDKDRLLKEIQRQTRFTTDIFLHILESLDQEIEKLRLNVQVPLDLENHRVRIATLAFVQNKLHRSASLSNVDPEAIIRRLIPYLLSQMRIGTQDILFQTETNNILLDIRQATPCCLITIELITNALRHAFPGARAGEVRIRLSEGNTGGYALSVKDNGVGFPKNIKYRNAQTLGMKLVMDLVLQLRGTISLHRSQGTEFVIRFA